MKVKFIKSVLFFSINIFLDVVMVIALYFLHFLLNTILMIQNSVLMSPVSLLLKAFFLPIYIFQSFIEICIKLWMQLQTNRCQTIDKSFVTKDQFYNFDKKPIAYYICDLFSLWEQIIRIIEWTMDWLLTPFAIILNFQCVKNVMDAKDNLICQWIVLVSLVQFLRTNIPKRFNLLIFRCRFRC